MSAVSPWSLLERGLSQSQEVHGHRRLPHLLISITKHRADEDGTRVCFLLLNSLVLQPILSLRESPEVHPAVLSALDSGRQPALVCAISSGEKSRDLPPIPGPVLPTACVSPLSAHPILPGTTEAGPSETDTPNAPSHFLSLLLSQGHRGTVSREILISVGNYNCALFSCILKNSLQGLRNSGKTCIIKILLLLLSRAACAENIYNRGILNIQFIYYNYLWCDGHVSFRVLPDDFMVLKDPEVQCKGSARVL